MRGQRGGPALRGPSHLPSVSSWNRPSPQTSSRMRNWGKLDSSCFKAVHHARACAAGLRRQLPCKPRVGRSNIHELPAATVLRRTLQLTPSRRMCERRTGRAPDPSSPKAETRRRARENERHGNAPPRTIIGTSNPELTAHEGAHGCEVHAAYNGQWPMCRIGFASTKGDATNGSRPMPKGKAGKRGCG